MTLDKAARLNFDGRKHTDGRAMGALSLEQLKKACRSDVSQTYRLWKAHIDDTLQIPRKDGSHRYAGYTAEDGYGGPGQHMPDICPVCHDVGSLEFVDADTEDMTEGQLADYLAGTWGFLFCSSCEHQEYWEM